MKSYHFHGFPVRNQNCILHLHLRLIIVLEHARCVCLTKHFRSGNEYLFSRSINYYYHKCVKVFLKRYLNKDHSKIKLLTTLTNHLSHTKTDTLSIHLHSHPFTASKPRRVRLSKKSRRKKRVTHVMCWEKAFTIRIRSGCCFLDFLLTQFNYSKLD